MKKLLFLCALLLCAASAQAQTVYNPKRVQFDSPDHAAISQYVVEYWLPTVDPATGAPVTIGTIAKAQVTTTGQASPQYEALLSAITPMPAVPVGTTYIARLKSVGDGVTYSGESVRSTPSGPFAFLAVPRPPAGVSIR